MKRVRLIEDFIYEKGKKPESVAKKVKKLNKKIKKAVAKKEDLMKKSKEIEKEQKKGDAQPSDKLQKLLIKSQIKTAGIDAQKTQAKQQQLILKKKVKTAKDSEKSKKELTKENLFLEKDKLEWHDSDAPDANGRFKDLSPKDLAAWLIKTRKGDMKKISGSLSQQVAFNKNDDKEYVKKMEKTRKEVYKQLDRDDLLENTINKPMKKFYEQLDRESVNEKREDVGKYNTVKKVIKELGRRPSEQELATFINNNYYDVTEVEREDDDPQANDKIADLVAFYKFDIDDWQIAWFDAQNESLVTEASKDRMIKQIKRALKDGLPIYKLPMATQKYYTHHSDEFVKPGIKEAYDIEDVYDLIAHHRFNKDFKKLSANDKEWVENDAKERGFNESLTESDLSNMFYSLIDTLYEAKPGPDPYHRGLNDEDVEDKEDQIKKQAKMDDDDPDAYKEMPGDKAARKKGEVKTSKSTKKYSELYGDYESNESKNKVTTFEKFIGLNEEKAEGDRGKIGDDKIETALAKKAKDTGVPIGIIRIIMRRGMAAWKSGHRPGATQQMWGYAIVNAFLTKGEGTWGNADKDVAKEVRDGGYDKGLKESVLNEEDTYSDYPAAAKKNAKKAIDWKEEHGRDEVDAGTAVGWARAHQLAKGEKLSADTVKRMASFNRHRKNSSIKPDLKATPWKDKGYVSWLIWGGDEGVDWAIEKSKEIDALKEQLQYLNKSTLNEYYGPREYHSFTKTFGKIKYPKWVITHMEELVNGGFLDKQYNKEFNYMSLWLNKMGDRKFNTDARKKELGQTGYKLTDMYWNDLTGISAFRIAAASSAFEVSKQVQDFVANKEPVEPAYYLMKNYFNSFGISTNRSRIFDMAVDSLEAWIEDNQIETL